MKLTSSAFENHGKIPSQYTCDGQNINPPLTISDVPSQAKSLVLILDDPDAPKRLRADGIWDHWILFNLSPSLKEIQPGIEPQCVHGIGTSGNLDYFGPCPPDREHRYFFHLYAIDISLNLSDKATKQQVLQAIEGHILAQSVLIGRYERQ